MGLFSSMNLDTFETLFLHELSDLCSAEQQLTKALPLMAEAAHDPMLRAGFLQHLGETEHQITRLDRIFQMLGKKPDGATCAAMKGLVAEGQEIISAKGDPEVKDAALIAAAQRVEHYEISGYGTARTFAHRLGQHVAAQILEETLAEEKATDKKLTEMAERHINAEAATK